MCGCADYRCADERLTKFLKLRKSDYSTADEITNSINH
jgi:hypothetical protein